MEKIINEIKIDVPEGMEAYLENSTVKFKPIKKKLTYNDIAKELFKNKKTYYSDIFCNIRFIDKAESSYNDINNCISEKQLKKLLAINQLMNVAKYLNNGWQPNWNNNDEAKYFILIDYNSKIIVDCNTCYVYNFIYFKSKELAKQAINILGEETIKLALCTDW